MINRKDDPVAWAAFSYELEDAAEHLQSLLTRMSEQDDYGESELRIELGHVFSHLNRAWNSRNERDPDEADKKWEEWSQFPTDLDPLSPSLPD